jgi:hypothetical protein
MDNGFQKPVGQSLAAELLLKATIVAVVHHHG